MKTETKNREFKPSSTVQLVVISILVALLILMTVTGIGYIPVGPFKLTLLTLPVAIGAAVCGVKAGLILGAVFGLTSFATGLFGIDALAALLISLGWKQALLLFITCVVPRIACGLVPALVHNAIKPKNHMVADAVTCALVALINTALFLGFFWICFLSDLKNDPQLIKLFGGAVESFGALFAIFAGWNAVIEVGVNLVLGTAICKALRPVAHRLNLE